MIQLEINVFRVQLFWDMVYIPSFTTYFLHMEKLLWLLV